MDIKQANVSETDTGFRNSGCGSVCMQVVPPDPKVHKMATRSTCMDGGYISNKLDASKSIRLRTIYSYRESVSQSNEGQVYIDHSNTSTAFPTMEHHATESVYTRFNFHCPISRHFHRPKLEATPIVSESNISLSSIEGLPQQYFAEGLSDQKIDFLESNRRSNTLHHYKTGWQKWVSW